MGAAWGKQDAADCQAKGNSETARKAGKGRDQPPEPSVRGTSGALPAGCGVCASCRCSLGLLAPLQRLAGCRSPAGTALGTALPLVLHCPWCCTALVLLSPCPATPVRAGRGSRAMAVLLLQLADVQQNPDGSGEEELPHSSNSRDSYNAFSELSKTTRIDLQHNDSKTVNGHL